MTFGHMTKYEFKLLLIIIIGYDTYVRQPKRSLTPLVKLLFCENKRRQPTALNRTLTSAQDILFVLSLNLDNWLCVKGLDDGAVN